MQKNVIMWLLGGVLVIVLLIAWVTTGRPSPTTTTTMVTTPTLVATSSPSQAVSNAPSQAPTSSAKVKEFTVENKGLSFDPSEMKVKLGDKVRVTFHVNGGTHDWRLDEFHAATKMLSSGQEDTVEFTADKKGAFEFYCSVPGHRQAGMVGSFIVE